jgi:hypothetical protein
VKSRLGLTNPSNVKESINRLNGLLKAKECIRDIHSVINDLEKDIERSIRLDCALLLKDDVDGHWVITGGPVFICNST